MKKQATQAPPEQLSRQVEMRYVPATVKLSEIDHKTYADLFCHREDAVYEWDEEDEGNKMKLMAESFILEGQQVAVELIDDEHFPGKPDGTKPLLRGSRRVSMLHQCIERRIEPDRLHLDMEIKAILVSGGDRKDYLVRSVCDNELRESLSDPKKLEAAEKMLGLGVSATRAARALGMSATQFGRYTRRINSVAMRGHIASGHITATGADALLDAAGQFNRIAEMERDFATVVAEVKKKIGEAREKAARNKDKFDEKKHGVVKGYIKPAHVTAWVKLIREGKPFSIEFGAKDPGKRTAFACSLDVETGDLKIPSLRLDLYKANFADLGEVAGKLKLTADRVEQFYVMRKAQQELGRDRVTADGDKDGLLDYFRRHGDRVNAAKIEAEIARSRGVADPGHGRVAPRAEAPLADSVVIPAEPGAGDDEEDTDAYDPAIDGGPAPAPEVDEAGDAR